MGKFACYCGYIISDSSYPCPLAGELKWQPEMERQSQRRLQDVAGFFAAVEIGQGKSWTCNYFNYSDEEYNQLYSSGLNVAEVVDGIYFKISGEGGRCLYQCPECEKLYIQKDFYTNDWSCYEKLQVTDSKK